MPVEAFGREGAGVAEASTVQAVIAAAAAAAALLAPLRSPAAEATATDDADTVVRWVLATGDHHGKPFAVVDKRNARLLVFSAGGRLAGQAPVLLGEAAGDHTVPGVGDKPPSQVLPAERTTPAGRFDAEPGVNLDGEAVVWVDYDSGFAIHRVRPGRGEAARLQRLASPTTADNRASLGCVVVHPQFYEQVVQPLLGTQRAVVYVMPETAPVAAWFGGQRVAAQGR